MTIFRVFLEKLGGSEVEEYVGKRGEVFVDPEDGLLRVSDGETPGGIPIGEGGGGGGSGSTGFIDDDEVVFVDDNRDYVLRAEDRGKIFRLTTDVDVLVPKEEDVSIPLGSVYTFYATSGTLYFFGKYYDEDPDWAGDCISKNSSNSRGFWRSDDDSLVTLIKMAHDHWVINGSEVEVD